MNAQTLASGFSNVLQPGAEPSTSRRSTALKTSFTTAAHHAVPPCAALEAVNAEHAALLASYRADPVALRRAVAADARTARNLALYGTFSRIVFGQ